MAASHRMWLRNPGTVYPEPILIFNTYRIHLVGKKEYELALNAFGIARIHLQYLILMF